jgi:hypothetical protein
MNDPLTSGIEHSMSQSSVMRTGRSEFWSSSDSSTMIGTVYRNDTPAPSVSVGGGGVMSAFGNRESSGVNSNMESGGGGYRRELGGGGSLNLDLKGGWDERMAIPPLSPLPPVASPGRVEKVDGMRFEMIEGTSYAVNEKPLSGRGPLGKNPQNF